MQDLYHQQYVVMMPAVTVHKVDTDPSEPTPATILD